MSISNTKNGFNETGQSFGSNPASLKGKLQTLEVPRFVYCSNKLRTSPTSWTIIRKRCRFWEARKILWSLSLRWRLPMWRRVYRMSSSELSKRWKGISISKRRRIAASNNRSPHSKERRPRSNNSCLDFRGGLLSCRCRLAVSIMVDSA